MEIILPISLKPFSHNTLGCYGLKYRYQANVGLYRLAILYGFSSWRDWKSLNTAYWLME